MLSNAKLVILIVINVKQEILMIVSNVKGEDIYMKNNVSYLVHMNFSKMKHQIHVIPVIMIV